MLVHGFLGTAITSTADFKEDNALARKSNETTEILVSYLSPILLIHDCTVYL